MSGLTLSALLAQTRKRFLDAGLTDPSTDARLLIGGLLDIAPTALVTDPSRPISEDEARRVDQAVRRRLMREPVHRILGRREFFGLELLLSSETLEPRPDTEILVDHVLPHLERIAALGNRPRFIDFGTGTGAIALALLSQCPDAEAVAVDISEDALKTAERNARQLGLGDRFQPLLSDWAEKVEGTFDAIVSNPPYIPSRVIEDLDPEVRLHDPTRALDGGEDGLDAYRILARQTGPLLRPNGIVALEIGYDQKIPVTALFEQAGFQLEAAARDYGGNDRVLVFSMP